jgi:hypothetical protein
MKLVINKCYGGFSLSAEGVKKYAELKDYSCYFFKTDLSKGGENKLIPIDLKQANKEFSFTAFKVEDPVNYAKSKGKTVDEVWDEINVDNRPDNRSDPALIRTVEELGDIANGSCAQLAVIEIPDDVDYTIQEYDGIEWVAERHRTWG